jgi:hypothetical protein
MSETKTDTFSQYYRTRAKECRESGSSFRDPQARADMFKLAIEYDLKAKEAEANEDATSVEKELRKLIGLAAPLLKRRPHDALAATHMDHLAQVQGASVSNGRYSGDDSAA